MIKNSFKKFLKRVTVAAVAMSIFAGLSISNTAFATASPEEGQQNEQSETYVDDTQQNEQDETNADDTLLSEQSESEVADPDEIQNDDPEFFHNQQKENNIDDNGIALFAQSVSRKVTAYGIDVSEFNGTIDWKKVKEAGVNFAIIRIGYRGYGTGRLVKDASAERNLREATAAGVQVGAYFFSTAITETEAKEEAQMVIDIIKNYHITYPVVFDNEGMYLINGTKQRDYDLTSAQRTDMAIAFLDTIKAAGYTPMMYGNTSCYANIDDRGFDVSRLETKYEIWVAQYLYKNQKTEFYNTHEEAIGRSTSYSRNYSVWQFSSEGKIDGIAGKVDLDFWYEDIPKTQSAQITATQVGNHLNIQLKDVQTTYALGSVSVAVWSENNGQDDLKWYNLVQNESGWNVSVNLENHKKDMGIYNIHLYFNDLKGEGVFVTSSKVKISTSANVNINRTNTGFTVKISDIFASYSIKSLMVPVWSQKDGQDDIIWYQATKNGDSWIINVDISKHKTDIGIYNIHIYATSTKDEFLFLTSSTYNLEQKGWFKVNGKWYYFLEDETMQTGWKKIDGTWYYFEEDGIMQTGWKKINNIWYYMSGGGAMQVGWIKYNNKWYYTAGNGAMQTGWVKHNNKWYYLAGNGAMQTGWVKYNNKWYYLNSNGVMQTGKQYIDGKLYVFNSNGAMQ